jgi:hypothetical protein
MTISSSGHCRAGQRGFTPLEKQVCLVGEPRRFSNSMSFLTGFTLAEAMMATVVLAIAAAGVLLPFAGGAAVRAEGMRRTLAANLASSLMEEIINTSFNDIEDFVYEHQQETFDDPMYANFTRGARLDPDVQDFFKLVTVWVKYNGREITVVNRLVAR